MSKFRITNIRYFHFYCPGCKHEHSIMVDDKGYGWEFNDNILSPTFTPSLKNYIPKTNEKGEQTEERVCHLNITDGKIIFHSDSQHELAGQTIELPELNY